MHCSAYLYQLHIMLIQLLMSGEALTELGCRIALYWHNSAVHHAQYRWINRSLEACDCLASITVTCRAVHIIIFIACWCMYWEMLCAKLAELMPTSAWNDTRWHSITEFHKALTWILTCWPQSHDLKSPVCRHRAAWAQSCSWVWIAMAETYIW